MPLYSYKHPEKEEYIEIVQTMNEEHVYVDEQGIQWQRVFLIPNAAISSKIDGSQENFNSYFDNKKGTLGDAFDASKEAAEKRTKIYGHDPVQKEFFKDYSAKRKGLKHIKDTPDTQNVAL